MKKWLLLATVAIIAVPFLVVSDLLRPYRGYSGEQFVEVPAGSRAPRIAELLVTRGVLAHRWPFLALYALGRWRYRLEAGEYRFDRPLRPLDVYREMIHGKVYLRTVVVPEGADRFEMARLLEKHLNIRSDDFLKATLQTAAIRDLDPQAPTLEGYLFPDTYRFPHNATAASIISTMLARFRHVLKADFASDLKPSGLTLHDALTLASLVEKETPNPDERPIIAQVFELRIQKGMLLECDPTVLYAARLDHRTIQTITQKDLEFDSAYNTYAHAGLPPGPICSPGVASIRAALHPASTDYLYFVSNAHGGHVFARTLAKHQRNVARYRRQVAALRGPTPGDKTLPDQTLPQKRHAARGSPKRPAKGVRHAKQKATHHFVRPGKRVAGGRPARTP